MEIKSSVILESLKNDRLFRMELPVGAPLGDAYEAAWDMLNKIIELAKESVEKAKPEEKKVN